MSKQTEIEEAIRLHIEMTKAQASPDYARLLRARKAVEYAAQRKKEEDAAIAESAKEAADALHADQSVPATAPATPKMAYATIQPIRADALRPGSLSALGDAQDKAAKKSLKKDS